jgi:hypothetical protein
MVSKFTRRNLFALGAVVVAVTISDILIVMVSDRRNPRAERIRRNIYVQITRAGWQNARPEIYSVKGKADTYVTGALPVVGGCGVQLIFTGDGSGDYRVEYYTTSNPGEYIFSATGTDGKKYPDSLKELRNPTKQQLDQMLTSAGMTSCEPLPRG